MLEERERRERREEEREEEREEGRLVVRVREDINMSMPLAIKYSTQHLSFVSYLSFVFSFHFIFSYYQA